MAKRQISIAWIEETIKWIFHTKDIHNINISVNNCNKTIASVNGLNLYDFSELYSPININLDFNRIQDYDHKELLFIISHECAHVYYNHVLQNIF